MGPDRYRERMFGRDPYPPPPPPPFLRDRMMGRFGVRDLLLPFFYICHYHCVRFFSRFAYTKQSFDGSTASYHRHFLNLHVYYARYYADQRKNIL